MVLAKGVVEEKPEGEEAKREEEGGMLMDPIDKNAVKYKTVANSLIGGNAISFLKISILLLPKARPK